MNAAVIVVVVLGLLVGYWVVSLLLNPKTPPAMPEPSEPAVADAGPAASRDQALPPTSGSSWNETLGVSPSATPDEIRSAYHALSGQYHPDKVAALGVELRALAESKTEEIGAAYREGMRVNGISA